MKSIANYWRVTLSVLMLVAAVLILLLGYMPAKQQAEAKQQELETMMSTLQMTIAQDRRYADIQDQLPAATDAVTASRMALYDKFPQELKEEDQLMYVVYLERLFGTEISFSFGTVSILQVLSDGAGLGGLTLTVNYSTDYQGFKQMIHYLATDSRITSVQSATMNYNEEQNLAEGQLTLLCYLIDSDLRDYTPPNVKNPGTGKVNIFD
ncbi:MAG: hypothetical protein IJE29_05715 [Firmicutes bacterium]|nr:hypothetical protein [Bacillota bacterium]MBQ3198975.1 hypothetical protein [Bacillota bacterium]